MASPLEIILARRGLKTPEAVQEFLHPTRDRLLNPFLMKGMTPAVARIKKAQTLGEKVLVHGDYDVDGITGAAIVSLTLARLGVPHETFLPERKKDGYGVSGEAVAQAARDGIRLLITVDCGISAGAEIREAQQAGIEVIVLDHHRLPPEGLPPADVILNPLQSDCPYPFKELSAGGLAFKLSQALLGSESFEHLDLATLSTIGDLAPLVGENRILVKEGLELLSARKRTGLRALTRTAKLHARKIKASHVGFVLGPRINASGRMSSASIALRLLLTESEREAESLAAILELENRRRQQEERRVVNEAIAEVERSVNFARDRVIVVAREGWHAGVIGIVASRLAERYYRPALVIALEGRSGKGSGRSIPSFHLFNTLESVRGLLVEFGGHEQAAGFVVETARVPELRRRLNEYSQTAYRAETFVKTVSTDLEISLSDLTPRFLKDLELLEPFGVGNPRPVFLTRDLKIRKVGPSERNGKNRSRVWVTDGSLTFEAAFSERNFPAFVPEEGSSLDLAYSISEKNWEGESIVMLEAKEVRPPRLEPPDAAAGPS